MGQVNAETSFERLIADRVYGSDTIIEQAIKQRMEPVIPRGRTGQSKDHMISISTNS
jgi:hypothetical protein